jgi:hypothetical protein
MACRTILELSSELDGQLGWRKKEISTLTFAVQGSKGIEQLVNARAATCLLYAHWEGFIKNAAEAYLGFVAVRRLSRGTLAGAFRALIYKQELPVIRDLRGLAFASGLESCVQGSGGPDELVESGVIRTNSNLNYQVFSEILTTLGLSTDDYQMREHLINKSLVERRNTIAHGRELNVRPEDFDELRRLVVDMMDHFAVQVFMAASQREYLANP